MENYREIIAQNISALRKENNMTQSELAEKLHYSDKAISRWERGDTMPPIEVLCSLCDLYGVDLGYLVSKDNSTKKKPINKAKMSNQIIISLLAISIVWLIATCIYVYSGISSNTAPWIVFLWAVPASTLILDIFNIMWGKKVYSIIIRSLFIWSLLTCFYIQFLSLNAWLVFSLGVPLEIIVVLYGKLK